MRFKCLHKNLNFLFQDSLFKAFFCWFKSIENFYINICRELIYSNGTSKIEGEISDKYVPVYHESIYDEEEALLDKFS